MLLERILDQFPEPHFGYLRINIGLKQLSLENGNLKVENDIKFYFWINVYGVCSMNEDNRGTFDKYKYVTTNPPTVNGFKIMNDEKEMMEFILPKGFHNQGEMQQE